MVERIQVVSPGRGRRIIRAALLATLAIGVWNSAGSDAWAQLRSGRSERPLYYNQVQNEVDNEPVVSRPQVPSRTRTVGTRGRVVASGPARSIMESPQENEAAPAKKATPVQPQAEPVPPSVPEPSGSSIRPTPEPLPLDETMGNVDEGYYESGHGGCSCGHCNGGRRSYFADLAPGCCDTYECGNPCGGPLARLLGGLSVRAEVPITWRRGIGLPPLVTTATAGTAANVAGQLGNASTQILLGNQLATEASQAGVRITLGTWFDPSQYRGVMFRYMNAGDQESSFAFDSNSTPILARPISNITSGTATADTQLIAFPGDSTGTISASTKSSVDGFDIVLRRLAYRDRFTRVDWLMGYQHNRIAESLNINSNTLVVGNVPPLTGTAIAVSDRFQTTNNFNGAVLGLMSSRQFACWKFEAMGRMGLGSLERKYSASGSTTTTSSTGTVTTEDQGLLARNTNNQTRINETFVVAPEFGFNAGYYLTPNLDFALGYNYLLIGKVAQPGRQIDTTVNLSDPLTGFLRPGFVLDTQNYWVHSLNLGMQWRY